MDFQVAVSEEGTGLFTQKISIGQHVLTADEPVAYGGNDKGPSPYDFILAGLGACTAMTIRMYAQQKQIPLEKVLVKLAYGKIHAEDCKDCETKAGKIDHITRQIILLGNITPEQKVKLLEIANKCPVHRTLTSEINIETQLV